MPNPQDHKPVSRTKPWIPAHPTPWRLAAAAALALGLAACGGGSGGSAGGTGELRVALTDAPACGYDHIYVTVERVRVHMSEDAQPQQDGWSEIALFPPPRIDLLTLTNGVLYELGQTPLPAGDYTQIRLVLADNGPTAPYANAIVRSGQAGELPLITPSGQQSGLKLNAHFTVEAGERADLVLDFDACRSIVEAGASGRVLLKPVIQALPWPVEDVGGLRVEGHVLPSMAGNTSVSLQFEGLPVRATQPDVTGRFILSPVPEGDYDLVISSEGRVTAVITGVPVSADGPTVLNPPTQRIAPPLSAQREVTGTVAGDEVALVRALQMLTGSPPIERVARLSDADDGSYTLTLPLDAPIRAAWTGNPLQFAQDLPMAGQYGLEASIEDGSQQAFDIDLLVGNPAQALVVDFDFVP